MTDVVDQRVDNAETTVDNSDMQARFDHIKDELYQVWDRSVDKEQYKIEWVSEETLNWAFAEFLLKPENMSTLWILRDRVRILKENSGLRKKAWKDAVDALATFLDDIGDLDRMEKDYQEFMKKVENPKKLNTLKSWEIRRLNIYLWMHEHESEALAAYQKMRDIIGKFDEKWMKSEDRRFFESVWDTIESNYSDSDAFMNADYPALTSLEPKVASLKAMLGENWDGKNQSVNVPAVENSIVDKSKVDEKVREVNQSRIDSNKGIVKDITITVDDLTKFTKKDGVLKYEWEEFSAEKMMEKFWDKIKEAANNGTDFVSETERDSIIDDCKTDIFNKFKWELLNNTWVQEEAREEDEHENTSLEFNASKDIIRIKNDALKDKIKELWFTSNLDWDNVKFDINKVKDHLDSLKGKKWSELERSSQIDRQTWTIAVQIALMYLNWKDWSYKWSCDVTWIDWLRGNKSVEWIRGFQNKYSEAHSDKRLKPDGLPWSATINAILDELWWTTVVTTPEQDEDAEE